MSLSDLLAASRSLTEGESPDDATWERHSQVVGSLEPPPAGYAAAVLERVRKDDPLHRRGVVTAAGRNAEGALDCSPLLSETATWGYQAAVHALASLMPGVEAVPVPSVFRAMCEPSPWYLGRPGPGGCDFVALVALSPMVVEIFACAADARAAWEAQSYTGDAPLFRGKKDASQLHFTPEATTVFDESDSFWSHELSPGDVLICHSALPWRVQAGQPWVLHSINFATVAVGADWKACRSGWIAPTAFQGGLRLCAAGVRTASEVLSQVVAPVPEFLTAGASPPVGVEARWEAFVRARAALLEEHPQAWYAGWEKTALEKRDQMAAEPDNARINSLFRAAVKRLEQRVETMRERLPHLRAQLELLQKADEMLQRVNVESLNGKKAASWRKLTRDLSSTRDTLAQWCCDNKTKATDIYERAVAFKSDMPAVLELPLPPTEFEPITVSFVEAKAQADEAVGLLRELKDKHATLIRMPVGQAMAATCAALENSVRSMLSLMKSVAGEHDAVEIDCGAVRALCAHLRRCNDLVAVHKSRPQPQPRKSASIEDEDDEEDLDEDEDEGDLCDPLDKAFAMEIVAAPLRWIAMNRSYSKACVHCGAKAAASGNPCLILNQSCTVCVHSELNDLRAGLLEFCKDERVQRADRSLVNAITEPAAEEAARLQKAVKELRAPASGAEPVPVELRRQFEAFLQLMEHVKTELRPHVDDDEAAYEADIVDMEDDDSGLVESDEVEYEESSASEPSRKRPRDSVAEELLLALHHTPVHSVLDPMVARFAQGEEGALDAVRSATKMLKGCDKLWAVEWHSNGESGRIGAMFLTREEAQAEMDKLPKRDDEQLRVVGLDRQSRWPESEQN